MTKEMYEKCLNKDMVIFGKLPKDVQDEMKECRLGQGLGREGIWGETFSPCWFFNAVYRIDPATPYEQEFDEIEVAETEFGYLGVEIKGSYYAVSTTPSFQNCLGIIYEKDGEETLRTSVDLAFGTPKRVRFAK